MDLFGTAGIRGDARTRVTPELALAVGRAAGQDGDEFVVARDGRETGPALAAAVEAGLLSAGARVLRAGQLPTPALAYASRGRRGVMVTASHNPPADNGLKLFVDGQEYDDDAERRIEQRVGAALEPAEWSRWSATERIQPLEDYRRSVTAFATAYGSALHGLSVAVDCGNGMASLATPQVLRDVGAHVVTVNANVDGHFPGRESKPTAETLADLCTFVSDGDFELGVAHDGDADRFVVVDGDGAVVHEDTVIAIIAEHYVRTSEASDPVVVTTPNASARIDERVREAGGRVERVRLGALHEGLARVATDADEGTEVVFAAEPWKHVHPAHGPWIDGVASAALFCRLVAETGLDALRAPITERPYVKESVPCPDAKKAAAMADLAERLPEAFPGTSVTTDYGVRLERPDGLWVLVRPSGTEPFIRVYAEADDVAALTETAIATVEAAVEAA